MLLLLLEIGLKVIKSCELRKQRGLDKKCPFMSYKDSEFTHVYLIICFESFLEITISLTA